MLRDLRHGGLGHHRGFDLITHLVGVTLALGELDGFGSGGDDLSRVVANQGDDLVLRVDEQEGRQREDRRVALLAQEDLLFARFGFALLEEARAVGVELRKVLVDVGDRPDEELVGVGLGRGWEDTARGREGSRIHVVAFAAARWGNSS